MRRLPTGEEEMASKSAVATGAMLRAVLFDDECFRCRAHSARYSAARHSRRDDIMLFLSYARNRRRCHTRLCYAMFSNATVRTHAWLDR